MEVAPKPKRFWGPNQIQREIDNTRERKKEIQANLVHQLQISGFKALFEFCMSFLSFCAPACVFLVFLTWQDLKDEKQSLMEEKLQQSKTIEAQCVVKSLVPIVVFSRLRFSLHVFSLMLVLRASY